MCDLNQVLNLITHKMKFSLSKFIMAVLGLLLTTAIPGAFRWELALFVLAGVCLTSLLPVRVRNQFNTFTNGAGQVSQYGLAESFKRAKNGLISAFTSDGKMSMQQAAKEAENAVLSQSYLRLEQLITAGTTLIKFPILVNQPGQRATEVRLNQQDAFFVNNIQFYIALASSATANTFAPMTYPNPVTFAASVQLYQLYNGFLKITINKSVIVPNYPMTNFLQIPQTQLTAATNSPLTQFDPSVTSLWEPTINMIGTKQSDITIEVPSIITPDAFTYGIFILQGVLAQNVTVMS